MSRWDLALKDLIPWVSTIFIVAIVFSGFTTGCRETEETNRIKVQLRIEQEKTDQLKIQNGLPVEQRPMTITTTP